MENKVKVCMVVPSFSAKGGITSVVNGYKNQFFDKKYDLKYIETYCDGSKIKKIFKFIFGVIQYFCLQIFWKPQVTHIHSSFNGSFYRKKIIISIAKIFNNKIVNHIHGADFQSFYENVSESKKNLISKTYNKCDVIIALSSEWKKNLSKIVEADKIKVVENYSIIKKNENDRVNNYNVLFLGFLCERKGCFDIPYIVERVSKEIPNVKFILAGSGTKDDVKFINELVIKLKVEKFIEFPGWVVDDEKKELLENANLFFLPSYNEGMPMAILDAMGYALPIVSTNVGGISKIVKNDYNGYIFNPGDIEGLSDAIIYLLKNNDKLLEYGKCSVKIVKEKYSLDINIKKIKKIYNEI